MAKELIARGSYINLPDLGDYEDRFKEGEEGLLVIDCKYTPSSSLPGSLDKELRGHGVELTRPVEMPTSSPTQILIHFRKTLAPLAIIAIILIALIVLWLLIGGWQLFKLVGVVSTGIIILLAIVGVAAIYLILRGQSIPTIKVGGT